MGSGAGMENDDHARVGAVQGMCGVADGAGVESVGDSSVVAGTLQFEEEEGEVRCFYDANKGIDVCETNGVKASVVPFI